MRTVRTMSSTQDTAKNISSYPKFRVSASLEYNRPSTKTVAHSVIRIVTISNSGTRDCISVAGLMGVVEVPGEFGRGGAPGGGGGGRVEG
jgi:hypothetical protein